MVRLAQGRVPAFAAFEKSRDLVQEAEEAIDAAVTREGAVRAAQILREYAELLSKQMANAVEPQVKDQVENEILAIEDYVRRMETLA
jgi:hypothetical protein